MKILQDKKYMLLIDEVFLVITLPQHLLSVK